VVLLIVVLVFGRAIHSLSKIGDELYVEALEKGVSYFLYILYNIYKIILVDNSYKFIVFNS